mgnify:CR=1 FL=1
MYLILPLFSQILLYNMVLLSMVKSVNFKGKLSFCKIRWPSSNHGPLEKKRKLILKKGKASFYFKLGSGSKSLIYYSSKVCLL